MKIFVGYASRQGQSCKIAQWSADRFADAGHTVELMSMSDATNLNLNRFDRAVFVASVHSGHYGSSLIDFVSDNDNVLKALPNLLLSVSLAAGGHDPEDWRGLSNIVADLEGATGWAPNAVSHVAGAYVPSKYDLFTKFIMRRIIAQKDPDADLSADHEYTDWNALGGVLDGWGKA
ncbi:menaquinone-dependent protoporphyrinogen oxidase [Octadecabacter temperatus]|uniref:Protoporphyrinogen IX dehydrogenase n=1 Tax=Octadecabacter temperatus TaxID=1458307 RepID=A0A0K0Y116_9RHOB|nr:flavodoxin domain-containing protein [Octadecabacter temperatus]AKS44576.1 Protoporphyrinogen IX dehydrogenase [Octadecabacter temperatus]SIO37927.1 menaquinone-dependent protoporphyrinogen oxidase [Octadecabacter temperatus]